MKRGVLFLVLVTCGCSTSPVADFMDWAYPARPSALPLSGRGGVSPPVSTVPPPTATLPGAIESPAPVAGEPPAPEPPQPLR